MQLAAQKKGPRISPVTQGVRQAIYNMQLTARQKAAQETHDADAKRTDQDGSN
jgi:hypothetical protein